VVRVAPLVVCFVLGAAPAAAQDAAPAAAQDGAPASAQDAAPAAAQDACDLREAEELRAHLTHAERRASQWNFAWRLTFTAASVGSFAVAVADPFPELRDGLYVSGGKAAIGALARWIMPLRIDVPEANADPCADVQALRGAVADAAKQERQNFYLGHVGGILVNLGGAAIIWRRATLGQALLSIAIGYPVGLLSNYTMPRSSWRLHRERSWTVGAMPQQGGWLVTFGGEL
jgi:hypothetical protein